MTNKVLNHWNGGQEVWAHQIEDLNWLVLSFNSNIIQISGQKFTRGEFPLSRLTYQGNFYTILLGQTLQASIQGLIASPKTV